MTTPDEKDIQQRVETLVAAVKAKDLDTVKTIYAPDLVSFDIVPPLRHLGAEAKWNNWTDVFSTYQDIDYESRDLAVMVDGDLGVVRNLYRMRGTLANGTTTEYWLRWTACFRRVDGQWMVAHDHVSVPTEFTTGRSMLNLEP